MSTHELHEHVEHAEHKGQKRLGITMAVIAVLLAIATMLGHRMHTEEVLMQTQANDQWSFFQAKNIRSHMYTADEKLAMLAGKDGEKTAEEFKNLAEKQKAESEEIKHKAEELEEEAHRAASFANHFDLAEIFFEIAIVLCSISLLAGNPLFVRISYLGVLIGIVISVHVLFLH